MDNGLVDESARSDYLLQLVNDDPVTFNENDYASFWGSNRYLPQMIGISPNLIYKARTQSNVTQIAERVCYSTLEMCKFVG